jgi:hypothetical protein
MCQRYYYRQQATAADDTFGSCYNDSTTVAQGLTVFPVTMRSSPTSLEQSGTAGNYRIRITGANITCSAVPTFASACPFSATYLLTVASGLTAGQASLSRAVNSSAYLAWSAEL